MKCTIIFLLASIMLVTSCTTIPINESRNPSIAVVSVEVIAPIKVFSEMASNVCLQKVSNNTGVDDYIICSNFHKKDRVYFLNLTPGEYFIKSASYRVSSSEFNIRFSNKSVEKTRFKLSEGDFIFLGKMRINSTYIPNGGLVESLKVLTNLLSYSNSSTISKVIDSRDNINYQYRGELIQLDNSSNLRNDYLNSAMKDLEDGGWESTLK